MFVLEADCAPFLITLVYYPPGSAFSFVYQLVKLLYSVSFGLISSHIYSCIPFVYVLEPLARLVVCVTLGCLPREFELRVAFTIQKIEWLSTGDLSTSSNALSTLEIT